jgi:superfamily II DNA or RNA helicase
LRARRRAERGLGPADAARGLGKLLVVAPNQAAARRYRDMLRGWMPETQAERAVRLATSDARDAQEALAAFRLQPEPSILVTVAMAYEGLDAPEVAVVAALTHIRSKPWLEQMVARATRIDPNAGPYESQNALVFHPDDPLFAHFRHSIETEQRAMAQQRKRKERVETPSWIAEHLAAHRDEGEGRGITPLESNALGLRYATLRPGPAFAQVRPEHVEAQTALTDPPSVLERRLRTRIGEVVAAQAVEDEASLQVPRGQDLNHRYNAVLKRVLGDKARSKMTLAELEAALAWLERNRLADHLFLLEGDARYAWDARRRSEWRPRAGRTRTVL